MAEVLPGFIAKFFLPIFCYLGVLHTGDFPSARDRTHSLGHSRQVLSC